MDTNPQTLVALSAINLSPANADAYAADIGAALAEDSTLTLEEGAALTEALAPQLVGAARMGVRGGDPDGAIATAADHTAAAVLATRKAGTTDEDIATLVKTINAAIHNRLTAA
jgi:hypothetical protein